MGSKAKDAAGVPREPMENVPRTGTLPRATAMANGAQPAGPCWAEACRSTRHWAGRSPRIAGVCTATNTGWAVETKRESGLSA